MYLSRYPRDISKRKEKSNTFNTTALVRTYLRHQDKFSVDQKEKKKGGKNSLADAARRPNEYSIDHITRRSRLKSPLALIKYLAIRGDLWLPRRENRCRRPANNHTSRPLSLPRGCGPDRQTVLQTAVAADSPLNNRRPKTFNIFQSDDPIVVRPVTRL